MTIDLSITRDLYGLFYQLAFGSFLIILIAEGIKRKYPLSTWLLLTAFVSSCMIIGSKLNSSVFDAIRTLSLDPHTIDFSQKSAVGGFLFGFLGLVAIRYYFGIKRSFYDVFAFALPTMMLFQRLGCLSAGCCYGTQTECSVGIHYQGISSLLDRQINAGLLPYDSITTQAVHPVPLYFVAASLIIIGLLFLVKNRLKQAGSLALLSLLSMMTARFIIDFFRAPMSNVFLEKTFLGLQMLQWILLSLIIIGSFFLFRREQKQIISEKEQEFPIRIERNLAFIVLFSLFIFSIRNWLKTEEIAVLHLQIGVAAIALLFVLHSQIVHQKYQFAPTLIVALSFITMGFTYDFDKPDVLSQQDSLPSKSYLTGSYRYNKLPEVTYPCTAVSEGCIGPYCSNRDSLRPFGRGYNGLTFGYETSVASTRKSQWIFGATGNLEQYYNAPKDHSEMKVHLHLSLGRENKYGHGIRLGVRLGSLYNPYAAQIHSVQTALPTMRVSIGYEDYLSLRGSIFDSDLLGMSNSVVEIKITSGRLKYANAKLGNLGAALGMDIRGNTYYYLQNEFIASPRIYIKPSLGLTLGNDASKLFNASMGLRYNLDVKK